MTFRDEKHENNLDIFESGDDFDVGDDLDIDDIIQISVSNFPRMMDTGDTKGKFVNYIRKLSPTSM